MKKELSNHIRNTVDIALEFGTYLELSQKDVENLVIGTRYHDIGKAQIPNGILYKKGKLSKSEFDAIKKHPFYSYHMLKNEYKGNFEVLNIALLHHERVDGTGYPFGLVSKDIPFLTKITSICDSFEAMTGDRGYKKPMGIKESLEEIRNNLGKQFDYDLGTKFIDFIGNKNKMVATVI